VDAAELGESYATNGRYNMVNPIINDGKLGASYAMMVNPIIKHPQVITIVMGRIPTIPGRGLLGYQHYRWGVYYNDSL